VFKRGRNTGNAPVSLPDERRALVERYMIDAEEAAARAAHAAEAQARAAEAPQQQVPAEEIHLAVEPEHEPEDEFVEATAHLQLASTESRAVEQAAPPPPVAPEIAEEPAPEEPAGGEASEDLPVYGWLQRVVPTQPVVSDWPRELVRAKEARGDGTRSLR
jgi:hypothetical protein